MQHAAADNGLAGYVDRKRRLWLFSLMVPGLALVGPLMYMLVSLLTGLRAPALHEQRGLDLSEHAESGYPEFPQNTLYNSELTRSAESRP